MEDVTYPKCVLLRVLGKDGEVERKIEPKSKPILIPQVPEKFRDMEYSGRGRGRPRKYDSDDATERHNLSYRNWLDNNPQYRDILNERARRNYQAKKQKIEEERRFMKITRDDAFSFLTGFTRDDDVLDCSNPLESVTIDLHKLALFLNKRKIKI